ncbi:FecR domain-containing protein [Polynucleobacter sp. VK25]|uniref:FecR domain-containing protein n=1 Tax=Polynucleobacter sp. VK25 TaxID=1758398 RepID=UPI001BFDF867|nr:FecR domain-containing protein [Polynucleobacter sp. VK25]
MFPNTLRLLSKSLLGAIISAMLITSVQAQAPAEAGKVLLAIGEVKVSRGGQMIPLTKGASLQAGDGVITGVASNAQLRMSDGAVIALRAQSEFKINQYNFNGKTDGSEKAELSLVKGGVRAVTGAIGRENKDNLKINAVVATVGIRGTGFNINVCEGNCFNPDKTPVKDGLYAGVFEGKIVVKNEASVEAVGVNQYLYVADKDTAPKFIMAPPNFLPDPLTGQKSAKPRGRSEAATEIPSLAVAVSAPGKAADAAVSTPTSPLPTVTGVTVTQPPALASAETSPFSPTTTYNILNAGDGTNAPTGAATYILQKAEVWSGATGSDLLPIHSITPGPVAEFSTVASGTLVTQISDPYATPKIPAGGTISPTVYAISGGQQMEGGTWGGVIAWGRWANGDVLVGGYNNGSSITYAANSGFAYIVGAPSAYLANQGTNSYTFTLVGASTPVPVSNPQGTWSVTGGSLTANFANPSISGNLAMVTNQPAGYGTYNMTFNGGLSTSSPLNSVSTFVSKISGSLGTCSAGCSGAGNVGFYGGTSLAPAPTAAGLAYNFNTGTNVVQGVAVFKR